MPFSINKSVNKSINSLFQFTVSSTVVVLFFLIQSLAYESAAAESRLYACKNSNGSVSYLTNPSSKAGCVLVQSFEKKPQQKKKASSSGVAVGTVPQSSSSFNLDTTSLTSIDLMVDSNKQKILDDKRALVLVHELRNEINQKEFVENKIRQTKRSDKKMLSYLKNRLRIHNQSIVSVKQELSRLGVNADNPSN